MPQPVIVNNFQAGTADSPIEGIAAMHSIDISTYPGVARISYNLENTDSTAGLPKWFARYTNGDLYTLKENGSVYVSTDDGDTWTVVAGNTVTGATGQGLAIWKDYLIVVRSTKIDTYGPLSGVAAWVNDGTGTWPTYTAGSIGANTKFHPCLVGQDDIVYVGNNNLVASLQEVSGSTFDPTDNTTYTLTGNALDLPNGYNVKCLAELGVNLLIGTTFGASADMDAPTDFKIADIFPWDRSSPSFDIPLRINENGIHAMVNKDNIIFVIAGLSGNIFATNGTTIRFIRRIPETIALIDAAVDRYLYAFPGAIMVHRNKIYFGVSANSGGEATGIWSLDTASNAINYENRVSTPAGDTRTGCLISVDRVRYAAGWDTASLSDQGIDVLTGNTRETVGTVESQIYRVGTAISPATYANLLVQLGRPLQAGQYVTVGWREAGVLGSLVGYTDIATFDTDGEIDFKAPANVENVTNVQLMATLGWGSGGDTPELMEVRLQ